MPARHAVTIINLLVESGMTYDKCLDVLETVQEALSASVGALVLGEHLSTVATVDEEAVIN